MSRAALTRSFAFRTPGYRTTFAGKPRAGTTGAMYGGYQAPTSSAFGGTLGPANFTPNAAGTALVPNQPKPASQPQPVAPVNSAPITPSSTDPRDPTYWTNVGLLNLAYNNTIAGLNARDTAAQTSLTNTLAQLNQNEPIDQRHLRENYNAQGLFYSGHLGDATGNLIQDYANRRTAANTEYATEHGDYLTQMGYLPQKLNLDIASELNAATGRQITKDQSAADNNGLAQLVQAISSSGTPAKPTVTGQTAQPSSVSNPGYKTVPYTNSQGIKGVLHIYPDGRKVFVRASAMGTVSGGSNIVGGSL